MQAVAEAPLPDSAGLADPPVAAPAAAEEPIDARWEFDAPRFYDFGSGSPQGGAAADAWFDTDATKGLASPDAPAESQQGQDKQGTKGAKQDKSMQEKGGEPSAAAGGTNGGGKAGKAAGSRPALAPLTNTMMAPMAVAAAVQPASKAPAAQPTRAMAPRKPGPAAAPVPVQDQAAPSTSQPDAAGAGSSVLGQQQEQQQQEGRARASSRTASHQQRHRTTVPASPHLRVRLRSCGHETKTTEQLELERLEAEKQEAAQFRRRNAEAVKAVLAPPLPPAVHSAKPLTEPVAVELRTSKRQRQHAMETRSMAGSDASEGQPVARPKPKRTEAVGQPAGLTVPKSPQFATKKRVRPPRFKPREVVEEEEMAAMPKFKARPFDKDALLAQGKAGVPWVAPRPPTAPEPFHLTTDQRAEVHGGSSDAKPFVFKAEGGEGGRVTRSRAKKQWTGELTNPQPFALATDVRAAISTKRGAAAEEQAHESWPAKRARRQAGGLETEARGALAQARLEQARQEEEERRRREVEFHAQPLNREVLERPFVPIPASADLTVPQEVALATDSRAGHRAAFDEQVAQRQREQDAQQAEAEAARRQEEEEELRQLRRLMVPKARPLPDGTVVPGRALPHHC